MKEKGGCLRQQGWVAWLIARQGENFLSKMSCQKLRHVALYVAHTLFSSRVAARSSGVMFAWHQLNRPVPWS